MVELNWTDRAVADLSCIGAFIAKDSALYARITVSRIRERARQLIAFPLSGRIVAELDNPEVRELVHSSYRIVYRVVSPHRVDITHRASFRTEPDALSLQGQKGLCPVSRVRPTNPLI